MQKIKCENFLRAINMKGNNALFGKPNNNGSWISNAKIISSKHHGLMYDFKNHIHPHNLPIKNIPNSTIEQRDDDGKLIRIRHYDENGNAYKDVDYTDHGRPDTHKVPHTHIIEIGVVIDRKKGAKSHVN